MISNKRDFSYVLWCNCFNLQHFELNILQLVVAALTNKQLCRYLLWSVQGEHAHSCPSLT